MYYDNVISTNEIALSYARDGYQEGTVVLANAQQKGRGRHGRHWISPPDKNIYMSIILRPGMRNIPHTLITIATSLSVLKAIKSVLQAYGRDSTVEIWCKWPNDVHIGEKKISGVLTEAKIIGNAVEHLVVGIGVNVNMPPEDFPPEIAEHATSIYKETGLRLDRGRLISDILRRFGTFYDMLYKDREGLLTAWTGSCKTIGSYVKVITSKKEVVGKAIGVNEQGFLQVQTDRGIDTFSSADVIHLR